MAFSFRLFSPCLPAAVIAAVALSACGEDGAVESPGNDVGIIGVDAGGSGDTTPEGECTTNADCPGGYRCNDRVCVSIDLIVCEPGASRCFDDLTLNTCVPDGTREISELCADEAICLQDDGVARCAAIVCAPNEVGCINEFTAFICDTTGTEQTPLACRENQFCADGTCMTQVCEPGTTTCENSAVVVCDALGAESVTTACADVSACAANEAGCTCVDGACEERTCVPGTSRCLADASQACAADGLSFEAAIACEGEEFCVSGVCVGETCEPGSRACSGNSLVVCDADTSTPVVTSCSDTDQICTGTGAEAACTDPVCPPESSTCSDDATAVLVCDALGSATTEVPCDDGEYCLDGICLPRTCAPGDAPVCLAGDLMVCDSLGADYSLLEECTLGSRNECCASTCEAASGCASVATSCGTDVCGDPNTLEIAGTCTGCGGNGANGTCSAPRVEVCNAGSGGLCRQTACGGTTYTCSNQGGTWAWRTAAACDDGNLCTFGDSCSGGSCAGTTIRCDGDTCTNRSCNGTSTCTETVAVGRVCDDFSICTTNDRCDAAGECTGTMSGPTCNRTPTQHDDLIFTEFMAKSRGGGGDLGEWFEVLNLSPDYLDLSGCEFYDNIGSIAAASGIVAPNAYATFALSSDSAENGGVSPLATYADLVLNNTGDTLGLRCGLTVIDEVIYTTPWVLDATTIQLRDTAAVRTTAANDLFANWCVATTTYGDGRFFGTPGRASDCR